MGSGLGCVSKVGIFPIRVWTTLELGCNVEGVTGCRDRLWASCGGLSCGLSRILVICRFCCCICCSGVGLKIPIVVGKACEGRQGGL